LSRRLTIAGILVVLLTLAASTFATGDDDAISVFVSIDRDTIGIDEQAVFQIQVSGSVQDLPEPRMPTLPKFEVFSQGHSSNISIVNGVVTSSVTYRFILMPTKAGTYPISPIAVVYKNKRYKGNNIFLTVIDQPTSSSPILEERAKDSQGESRDYFFEASVDKRKPYVNQQVTLTLKFYIGVRHYGNPELTEPSTSGFWTEVLGTKNAYYQILNNRRYKVLERKYALFPTQTAELTIGRASIRVTVPGKRSSRRDPFDVFGDFLGRGTDVTVRSQPVSIDVQPLPREGRPREFDGTIGRYSISATADKREAEVNQPVTVTFRLDGTGNIKSAGEPLIPESDDFRIYRASTSENISRTNDRLGGAKIYEEVFIPKRPGDLEIPAITYWFFDPDAGQYKKVSTRPIKIKAIKPEGYIASPDVPYASPDMTISSETRDIRFIKDDPGPFAPIGRLLLTTPLYLTVNGVPVLILAAVVVIGRRREKLAGNVGLARSRAAGKVARKRLAKASSLLGRESAEEFYAEVHLALLSYLADKFNISPHGLTSESIKTLLLEKKADSELVEAIMAVIKRCDFARFALSAQTPGDEKETLEATSRIIVKLEGMKFD